MFQFEPYTNFVWLLEDRGGPRVSDDLLRFQDARHPLPLSVLDHFSAQGGGGGGALNLSLSSADWTALVESYCKRRVAQVRCIPNKSAFNLHGDHGGFGVALPADVEFQNQSQQDDHQSPCTFRSRVTCCARRVWRYWGGWRSSPRPRPSPPR